MQVVTAKLRFISPDSAFVPRPFRPHPFRAGRGQSWHSPSRNRHSDKRKAALPPRQTMLLKCIGCVLTASGLKNSNTSNYWLQG